MAATSCSFFLSVGGAGVRGAGHRVHRLAAGRDAGPRQALLGVAPDDLELLPRRVEHLGVDALAVEHRLGAEVADAGLHLHLAVGPDDRQPVEADRPGGVGADGHADAAHLRAALLAADRLLGLPAEDLGALVERLADVGLGDVGLLVGLRVERPVGRLADRGVDLEQLDVVDPELLGGLRHDRVEDGVHLHAAGRTLRGARRGVGEHGDAAPPVGLGLEVEGGHRRPPNGSRPAGCRARCPGG